MPYIKRAVENILCELNTKYPVIIIYGAYGIGKTTLIKRVKTNHNYITFENPMLRYTATENPSRFLKQYELPLIIDEFLYVPEILPIIRKIIDDKDTNGLFWLITSVKPNNLEISRLLNNKVDFINMTCLMNSEILGKPNGPFNPDINYLLPFFRNFENNNIIPSLFAKIYQGFFPDIISRNIDVNSFYDNYLQEFLKRNYREYTNFQESAFIKFLTLVAKRASQELKYSSYANEIGINQATIKRWFNLLTKTNIIFLLPPYKQLGLRRLIKSPKHYFYDTGFCAYLSDLTSGKELEESGMVGAMFENYVVSEIVKSYLNNGKNPNVSYYRDGEQREIDLIIINDNFLYPIEIKKNNAPNKKATKHFFITKKFPYEVKNGLVICSGTEFFKIEDSDYWIIPASIL